MNQHPDRKLGLDVHFQTRVLEWVLACIGSHDAADTRNRNHRFLEEALELVQSLGCSVSEAHQLVDYVFNRPVGDPIQELGGTLLTLHALASAANLSVDACGETELDRVWGKVDSIRAKHQAKPKHSPLPVSYISIGDITVHKGKGNPPLSRSTVLDLACTLVDEAERSGFVLTIQMQNRQPPAMGNYEPVVEVRDSRKSYQAKHFPETKR